MILIPELSTVLILTPRTGSETLRRALLAEYPKAVQIYRHMEADGVPQGYDSWRRIGVVRNPVDRLWSLYKFLGVINGPHDPAFIRAMRESAEREFSDWALSNEVVFTSPYDRTDRGRFWPEFCVRHPLPENRKSQRIYIRPDLGTEWWTFDDLESLADELGVQLTHKRNATGESHVAPLSPEAAAYIDRVHRWDF